MCGTGEAQRKKLEAARRLFSQEFGRKADGTQGRVLLVHAPGRSEIAGNHTDHEGGQVIAGALDVSIEGVAMPNGTDIVRLASQGYPNAEVALDDLAPRNDQRNTTAALVRGMASELAATGRTPQGFDMAITCDIPAGGGLSSSAAVEAAIGRAMEALWDGAAVEPMDLARMSQRTENVHFGKPCGLMDQASVCLGGLAHIDFHDPDDPRAQKLDFDFDSKGYALCLVDVHASHADLTDQYAAIPAEMQAVAAKLGHTRLSDVDPDAFDQAVPQLRQQLGDRPVLRALHYWRENQLVQKRWDALTAGNIDEFLDLTRQSGASSAMFLQNVTCDTRSQPAMVALGLAERVLDGRGAARIHGGGFGGTIQCFVPLDLVQQFGDRMDAWLGQGSCRHYHIDPKGAYAQWQ